MKLSTEQQGDVAIVRVEEARMLYPALPDFADTVNALIADGQRKLVIDLTPVVYVDSATIGCLMDIYRRTSGSGGQVKLSGVGKRVETMLTMTGTQNFIEVHADAATAAASFGA